LKIKSRLVKFKHDNVRGQREGLRSGAIIDRVHEKARAVAAKYRVARVAKFNLSGPGGWEDDLRVLADADIRSYQDPNKLSKKRGRPGTLEDGCITAAIEAANEGEDMEAEDFNLIPEKRDRRDGTGETRRMLSWIWLTGNNAGNHEGDEILQIEWAKSRARAARAVEEVLLLKEEMRRVIEFLRWKSEWWMSRTGRRPADTALDEGLRAYAHKQSLLQKGLSQQFQTTWRAPLQERGQSQPGKSGGENEESDEGDEDEDEGVGIVESPPDYHDDNIYF
jgi:hypothetical protein